MSVVDVTRRALSDLKERSIPQRVVFHHVPKCGGTSIGRALRKRYLLSQATVKPEESFRAFEAFTGRNDRDRMLVDVLDLREQMMLYLLFEDIRCVSLHVRFSETAYERFSDRYKFITILREPVERFISNYFYSHGRTGAHGCIDEDFETFLGTPRARRMGATYSEFYCGLPISEDFAGDRAVSRAIENIGKFDVVGRLDDLGGFMAALRKELGVAIRIGHENKLKKGAAKARERISPEQIERVRDLCQPDIAIWNHVTGGCMGHSGTVQHEGL